jgi:hypothetical protein
MGCRQCLSLSVFQLKGNHCRKPHCRNGVVDTFRRYLHIWPLFTFLNSPNVQNVVPIDQYKTFQSHKEDFPKLKQISTINFASAISARAARCRPLAAAAIGLGATHAFVVYSRSSEKAISTILGYEIFPLQYSTRQSSMRLKLRHYYNLLCIQSSVST